MSAPCPRSIHLAVSVAGEQRPNLLFPMWDRRNRVAFARTIRASIRAIPQEKCVEEFVSEILVTNLELGDRPTQVRARWIGFLTRPESAPVPECSRSMADPVLFNREVTDTATMLRPNLLSPKWWRGGIAATANVVLPSIVPFETEDRAA